ncbi:MAG: hypothetical protein ACE5HL_10585 [Terriglobia bacterium]
MKSLLAVSLVLLVPLTAVAELCPFMSLPERPKGAQKDAAEATASTEAASVHPQAPPETERPAAVDPKLLNKKVVVHLHDGRVYKGKLVEITDDFLLLKMHKRTEKIMLTEVASVERQRRNKWKIALIVLAVYAAIGIVVGAIVAGAEE